MENRKKPFGAFFTLRQVFWAAAALRLILFMICVKRMSGDGFGEEDS